MSRANRVWEGLGVALLLALTCLYAASPIFSIDFFWHLKLGEVIRETGSIPRTDLFSAVHPERPYVQFNWLWELCAAWVQGAFGLRGVRVAQALVLGASYAILYARTRRALGSAALAYAFCALALVLFEDRFRARPSALALGFVAAMLPLLLGAHREGKPERASNALVIATLALSALWSNLHGGEATLLILSLIALLAGELVHRHVLKREDAAVGAAAQLLLAGLLGFLSSPTLVDGISHWLTAVAPQMEAGNEEWLPSYTMLRNGWRPAFILIGLGPTAIAIAYVAEQVARVRRDGWKSIDVSEWFLAGGYAVLSHHAVRNAFLCLLPLLFMMKRALPKLQRTRAKQAAIAVALVLLGISFEDAVLRGYGGLEAARVLIRSDLSPSTYPEHVARFIREAGITGRIANDGRMGGYLIWRTWPQCSVFADSRHDFTPEMWSVFLQTQEPMQRPLGLQEGFTRFGLELAVFHAPTFPLHLPAPGWRLLYKAGDEELFQHEAGEHAARNIAATRAWLAREGIALGDDPSGAEVAEAATQLGAKAWLATPYRTLLMQRAQADIESADAQARANGHMQRGGLLWQTGAYAAALRDLDAALALVPSDPSSLYHAALCDFALGDLVRAKQRLHALARVKDALPPAQSARMAMLERALSRVP